MEECHLQLPHFMRKQSGLEATTSEPRRYSLKDALELRARYGSLQAAEAAMPGT